MAPMTGELQWRDTGSLVRTAWEDEERALPFLWEELKYVELLNKSQLKITNFFSLWCSFAMCQPRNEPHSACTWHFEKPGLLYPATQVPSLWAYLWPHSRAQKKITKWTNPRGFCHLWNQLNNHGEKNSLYHCIYTTFPYPWATLKRGPSLSEPVSPCSETVKCFFILKWQIQISNLKQISRHLQFQSLSAPFSSGPERTALICSVSIFTISSPVLIGTIKSCFPSLITKPGAIQPVS